MFHKNRFNKIKKKESSLVLLRVSLGLCLSFLCFLSQPQIGSKSLVNTWKTWSGRARWHTHTHTHTHKPTNTYTLPRTIGDLHMFLDFLSVWQAVSLSSLLFCLSVCRSAFLSSYVPACFYACQSICLPDWLSVCAMALEGKAMRNCSSWVLPPSQIERTVPLHH